MRSVNNNSEAVSPVIGVILMVAITVILAAVITAFVFGMAGNVQPTKIVGISVSVDSSNNAIAKIVGGSDIGRLTSITYTIDDGDENFLFNESDIGIGRVANIPGPVKGKRITLMGHFTDGETSILIDKWY